MPVPLTVHYRSIGPTAGVTAASGRPEGDGVGSAAAGITTQLHRTTAVVSPSDDPVGRGDGKIAAKADGEIAAKAGGLQRIAEDVSRALTSLGGAVKNKRIASTIVIPPNTLDARNQGWSSALASWHRW